MLMALHSLPDISLDSKYLIKSNIFNSDKAECMFDTYNKCKNSISEIFMNLIPEDSYSEEISLMVPQKKSYKQVLS